MDSIHKGLVIREPWIDLLLSGQKVWEMRGQRPSYRGWIGLIRKGSGRVSGVARLVDVGAALSPDEMVATFDKHRIPEHMIRSGEVSKWTIPWKFADIRTLPEPVPYRHPNGAITLFSLPPETSRKILEQLGHTRDSSSTGSVPHVSPVNPPMNTSIDRTPRLAEQNRERSGALLGETELTTGNLKNDHFYLRAFLDRFPKELVGGRDRAPQVLAKVNANGVQATSTDICPRHRFFRDRSWTRAFLASNDAEPGDLIQVYEIAPLHYNILLNKKNSNQWDELGSRR